MPTGFEVTLVIMDLSSTWRLDWYFSEKRASPKPRENVSEVWRRGFLTSGGCCKSRLRFYRRTCIRANYWRTSVSLHFSNYSGEHKLQQPCWRMKNTFFHLIRPLRKNKGWQLRDIEAQPPGRCDPGSVQGLSYFPPVPPLLRTDTSF